MNATKEYQCIVCDKIFKRAQDLKGHTTKFHKNDIKSDSTHAESQKGQCDNLNNSGIEYDQEANILCEFSIIDDYFCNEV